MREGEPGDQAFLVADGELEVLIGGKTIATVARGDLVGEIALLRGGVRTASVISKTDSLLFELDRETFLETLGGAHAIQSLVDARLGELGRIRA
jgi:CRP-like cAMP-binding protein